MLLSDLPDEILLQIFSCFVGEQEQVQEQDIVVQSIQHHSTSQTTTPESAVHEQASGSTAVSTAPYRTVDQTSSGSQKSNSKKPRRGNRVAGLSARTLCRLCCCSHRFNHLASADQLWQALTLARFPDRHWPTTDQKNLELIRVRREHQLKLQRSSVNGTAQPAIMPHGQEQQQGYKHEQSRERMNEHQQQPEHNEHCSEKEAVEQNEEGGPSKKQKRTKFYSRFEQRAHRRKFASLDPELKYTPLAWTNTLWSWKRTFFGDCRFVESKVVQTPNRIASCSITEAAQPPFLELDQALDDPNCTPLLLYPSHSAVDIQTLGPDTLLMVQPKDERTSGIVSYRCQSCVHVDNDSSGQDVLSPYPYKLIIALDGSWSHAKIMYRCNPRLQQLVQVKFPKPPQSIYHELKPEPKVSYTSTAEAVGQAVVLLGWPSLKTAVRSTALSPTAAEDLPLTEAEQLMQDLIRPLKKMIEIQDTIALDRLSKQPLPVGEEEGSFLGHKQDQI
ncbi:hypothetical protein BG011_009232 [Mortierella polycephala]|uniref:tRNA-uridine aminocarboxypropyltransferase n=1 Tax=Mortierella polycephala TaxID=41804 RepID=A0A9P6Q8S0_9FUNG|nr:hypothetical protein BG011_009232 [Mortierella polycephala]